MVCQEHSQSLVGSSPSAPRRRDVRPKKPPSARISTAWNAEVLSAAFLSESFTSEFEGRKGAEESLGLWGLGSHCSIFGEHRDHQKTNLDKAVQTGKDWAGLQLISRAGRLGAAGPRSRPVFARRLSRHGSTGSASASPAPRRLPSRAACSHLTWLSTAIASGTVGSLPRSGQGRAKLHLLCCIFTVTGRFPVLALNEHGSIGTGNHAEGGSSTGHRPVA